MRLEDLAHAERLNTLGELSTIRQIITNKSERGNSMNAKLKTLTGDYRDVEIQPDSVIYLDPPYRDTREYREMDFDHEAFYDWCEKQTSLVVISEYWMPGDRFVCVAERERVSTFSATNNALRRTEKLFVPKHQYEMYLRMMAGEKTGQLTLDI